MKSVIFAAPNDVQIEDVEIPKIGKDDVLIKIEAAAICNMTDMHFLKGEIPGIKYPLPPGKPGHECSGVIVETGKNVNSLSVGDRVVPGPLYALPCGICSYCIKGMQELCEKPLEDDFAYAEYLKVPAKYCYPLADNVSFEEGALIDLLACALHGAYRASFSMGMSVVLIGQGPAGLLLTQLAKLAGASVVITADVDNSRLELSKKLGADFTINVSEENLTKKVLDLTGLKGCDISVDAVGKPTVASQAIEVLKPGGHAVIFGFHLKPAEIDLGRVFDKELEIRASFRTVGELDYRLAISLVSSGKINLKSLITHIMPLKRIRDALGLIEKKSERVVKVVLKP
jgi:L-iditol 2-dehydrogenase